MSTADKTERLMKLLIMLLVQRHLVPKGRIRSILYPGSSDEAFERMFERDKEELRSIGVPIEVGHMDAYFDDEPGYRIRPDEFALPDIDLTPDEASVVGLATRVWEHQRLAKATTEAVRKLTAAGVDIDLGALEIAQPRLGADEPTFDVFYDALTERSEVAFEYLATSDATPATRRLQPWGVTRFSGRWYVVGHDLDRDAERVFRLSRVEGEARKSGEPGAYEIPAGVDIAATTRRLLPPASVESAVLLVRTDSALSLRQDAERTETGVRGPDDVTGWDRIWITRGPVGLEDDVLSHGPAVVVEEPPALRERVVARLTAVLT